MFDHLSLGVRNLDAASRFYGAVLAPLGARETWRQENEAAFGPEGARVFWIYPCAGERVAGLGAHTAFRAESQAAVDAAFAAALAHGGTAVRPAGFHADIAPDYYGAVVLDPDGNKIEIVLGAMH